MAGGREAPDVAARPSLFSVSDGNAIFFEVIMYLFLVIGEPFYSDTIV